MTNVIFGQKRRIFLKLLLFAIFLATPIIGLEGATYYVSPTGSDSNPGTLASPWKTLAHSVSSVSSGDTVYLRSGTWAEKLEIESKAYTSKTTWARYPSDAVGSVILDGYELDVNQYEDGIVWVYISNNVRINGLKVIRAYRTGIAVLAERGVSGYDNEVLNCITDSTGQAGIEAWGVDGCLIQGNTISNANIGTMAWDDDTDPYGFEETLSITSCTDVEVCYNTLYGSLRPYGYAGGEGLNIKYGSSYVYVHHNYVDQARGGPGGEANDRYCMGIDCWTDERGDTHHIYFYNNIVKNGSYGINFNSEEGGYGHHFYAWNNIIIHIGHNSHMRGGGIGFPNWGNSPGLNQYCYFWNNTIYDCYYGARFYKEEIEDIFVQNNIFYNSTIEDIHFDSGVPEEEVTLDHNLLDTDPKFVNASGGNFYLQSDSPAIDAGIAVSGVTDDFDGIVRPQGAGYDIGAYEYNGTNPSLRAIASGNPTSGPAPLIVNFSGSATGGTPPYSYSWTFGDGGTSTAQFPSHTYSSAGNYTATLTVTDNNSETASDTESITVSSGTAAILSIAAATGAPAPGPGGTTNPSPGIYSYSIGSTVSISSIPNTDYRFSMWTGDVATSSMFSPTIVKTMNNDKSISATFCSKCGDVNGDLQISPSDAQAAFNIFLHKKANPTECELENADVNGSGTQMMPEVTPADAQMIFNKFLNKGTLSSDCSGASRSASLFTQTIEFSDVSLTINEIAVSSGQDIYIPIIIESPSEITAFGFDLVFPSNVLIFTGLERTGLTENFDRLDANVLSYQEMNHKILRVGGYNTDNTQIPSSGVLVTLVFRLKGELEDPISLSVKTTYDDIENATVQHGINYHQKNSLIIEDKRRNKNIKKTP